MDKKGMINYETTKDVKDHARVVKVNRTNEE